MTDDEYKLEEKRIEQRNILALLALCAGAVALFFGHLDGESYVWLSFAVVGVQGASSMAQIKVTR